MDPQSLDVSDGLSAEESKINDDASATLRFIISCHEGTGSPLRDAKTITASPTWEEKLDKSCVALNPDASSTIASSPSVRVLMSNSTFAT